VDLSGFGAHKGVEIGPLVTLVDIDHWPLSDRTPRLADDRLETQTTLVLTPQSSTLAVG
jgi:hypothetical protein